MIHVLFDSLNDVQNRIDIVPIGKGFARLAALCKALQRAAPRVCSERYLAIFASDGSSLFEGSMVFLKCVFAKIHSIERCLRFGNENSSFWHVRRPDISKVSEREQLQPQVITLL
jgi:hypothetical protein